MRLVLIRHGQTESNVRHLLDTAHPGAPLDDIGREQAENLVHSLAAEQIHAVFSSTITRAVQTATPLARALGVDVQQLPGLMEIQAGEEEMAPIEGSHYLTMVGNWLLGDRTATMTGADTCDSFFSRYDDAIGQIASAGHACVAVVSHGAAIRTWAGRRVGNISPSAAAHTRLDNTTFLVLEGDPETGWMLESWGEAGPERLTDPQP